jgi:hypothetical protein
MDFDGDLDWDDLDDLVSAFRDIVDDGEAH